MTIRAVLFDKDGTLLDFDATFGPAAHAVLSELCAGDAATMADLATIAGYDLATRSSHATPSFLRMPPATTRRSSPSGWALPATTPSSPASTGCWKKTPSATQQPFPARQSS